MSEQYKMYCPACHGAGFVYSGTGHRMASYPFAEKTASSERCYRCDNWSKRNKPMSEQELAEYNRKRNERDDAIIAKVSAEWEASKKELNERRAAAGMDPL